MALRSVRGTDGSIRQIDDRHVIEVTGAPDVSGRPVRGQSALSLSNGNVALVSAYGYEALHDIFNVALPTSLPNEFPPPPMRPARNTSTVIYRGGTGTVNVFNDMISAPGEPHAVTGAANHATALEIDPQFIRASGGDWSSNPERELRIVVTGGSLGVNAPATRRVGFDQFEIYSPNDGQWFDLVHSSTFANADLANRRYVHGRWGPGTFRIRLKAA